MRRLFLFVKYLQNNRIKDYELIIRKAIENKYEIISLRQYIEKDYNETKNILVLRHDVDHVSEGTKMMFEIEKKYKVNSSFYFRNSTYDPILMKKIETYGSESSLHFESISDFIKANPSIANKDDLLKTDFQSRCIKILKADLDRFRLLCDIPCLTIAGHGEKENILVETPNNFITEDTSLYEYLGIKIEAYNSEMISKITCYISDAPIEENHGFKYGVSPIEAIEKNEKFIMFLSHPNHWHYSFWGKFKKLVKSLLIGENINEEDFKRI